MLLQKGYEYVAYQDVGKVRSIVHYLNDPPITPHIVSQFGLITSGGGMVENYAWIAHQDTSASWFAVLAGLVKCFTEVTPRVLSKRSSTTSHYATIAVSLIRQHYLFTRPDTTKSLECQQQFDKRPMFQSVMNAGYGPLDGSQSDLGELLPCQYTFVNSVKDLELALALESTGTCSLHTTYYQTATNFPMKTDLYMARLSVFVSQLTHRYAVRDKLLKKNEPEELRREHSSGQNRRTDRASVELVDDLVVESTKL